MPRRSSLAVNKTVLRHLYALFFLFCAAGTATAAQPLALPPLTAPVVDHTQTLSPAALAALNERLTQLSTDKGSQIAILILPSTQPESIEQFSIRLAEHWKIGRSKIDDGVLIVVAKDDRTMRIEVGYGLEGAIPDAIAKRIIEEQMAPRFRDGDFAGGLTAAVDTLEKLIDGEQLPAPAESANNTANRFDSPLVFLVLLGASMARALFGLAGSIGMALLAAGLTWFSFGSLAAALGIGLFTFAISFIRFSPGAGGGGGRGGGGGGGGFSGGGGRFGGGGASGKW